MELIDFAEKRGEEAAKFSLATMDINRARAHTLLSLFQPYSARFKDRFHAKD